ncbi:lipid II flippase MurJ [Ktedonobacter sp. SOSP1-52]|uniref:murein biosynthesis integral membrane protein MurJ n=1 Tax=Ktedonobacter sp. SOSP1-52 TaxID=2778366 RepID=UPI00191610AE|nr:murein biosynthesis integral membrane protein MurJ [Ktedonobacter sp. SOSP1-52]GHO63787.1 lipid II flippase MurJ [Ktedonobacter sp. SOSP1-52]
MKDKEQGQQAWQQDPFNDGGTLNYLQGIDQQHIQITQPLRLPRTAREARLKQLREQRLARSQGTSVSKFRSTLRKLFSPSSVGKAALLLTFATFASRFLGLLRVSLFTVAVGVNDSADAFNLATQFPTTIYNIVAGGALLSAFIPIFNVYFISKKDEKTAWHLTSSALNLSTGCMVVFSLVGMIFADQLVHLYARNVSQEKLVLMAALTRILFLQTIFLGMGVIVNGVLNARQHFLLPALGSVLYPLGSILGLGVGVILQWTMHVSSSTLVIYCATWGVVLGAILMVGVQLPGLKLIGMQYHFTFDWRHPGIRQIVRQMLPRIGNALMLSFSTNVDLILIGLVVSVTGASTNGYTTLYLNAFTIASIPLSVIIQVATAAFPRMTSYVAEGRLDKLRLLILEALQSVLFVSIPAALGLVSLSLPMVEVLYHIHFDQAQATAILLICYALGLPGLALVEILTRPFYALRQSKLPVYVSIGQFVIKIALSLLFLNPMIWLAQTGGMHFWFSSLSQSWLIGAWGMGALALATSLAGVLEAGLLLWLLHIRVGGLRLRELFTFVVRIALASLAMLLAITIARWALDQWLVIGTNATHRVASIADFALVALKLALVAGIGGMVYLRTARFLRILGGERLRPIQRVLIRLHLAWV